MKSQSRNLHGALGDEELGRRVLQPGEIQNPHETAKQNLRGALLSCRIECGCGHADSCDARSSSPPLLHHPLPPQGGQAGRKSKFNACQLQSSNSGALPEKLPQILITCNLTMAKIQTETGP